MDVIKTLVYKGEVEPRDGEIYKIESIKSDNKGVICKLIKENSDYLKDASPIYLLNQPSTDAPFETIWKKKHQDSIKFKSVCRVYMKKYINGTLYISFSQKAPKRDKPLL